MVVAGLSSNGCGLAFESDIGRAAARQGGALGRLLLLSRELCREQHICPDARRPGRASVLGPGLLGDPRRRGRARSADSGSDERRRATAAARSASSAATALCWTFCGDPAERLKLRPAPLGEDFAPPVAPPTVLGGGVHGAAGETAAAGVPGALAAIDAVSLFSQVAAADARASGTKSVGRLFGSGGAGAGAGWISLESGGAGEPAGHHSTGSALAERTMAVYKVAVCVYCWISGSWGACS